MASVVSSYQDNELFNSINFGNATEVSVFQNPVTDSTTKPQPIQEVLK